MDQIESVALQKSNDLDFDLEARTHGIGEGELAPLPTRFDRQTETHQTAANRGGSAEERPREKRDNDDDDGDGDDDVPQLGWSERFAAATKL